ncbi:MAG: hypothetical protein K6E21_06475 [Bacilli bacterium]|nr:hypothetical protein [Bacilli bacterium]
MANKKLGKFLAVSCLLACGLAACDDIEARPSKNKDGATLLAFTKDVFDNNYKSLNDDYHGNLAAQALDNVLYTYAINVVGAYDATIAGTYAKKVTKGGEAIDATKIITLADVVADDAKLADFVKEHPAYDVGDAAAQKALITARYNAMKDAAAKKMFSKLSSATENNKFDEYKLLVSLFDGEGKNKVANPYTMNDADKATLTKDLIVTPNVKGENVFKDGILHENFYGTYIDDVIMPDIYRDALVQQYIFDNQEKTLGTSSARKVNYVSIKYDDLDESLYADTLVKTFVKDYLFTDKNTDTFTSFNTLSSIWNGEFMKDNDPNSPENKMLADMNINLVNEGVIETKTIDGTAYDYVKGSTYGDLVEDYAKLDPNPAKSNASRDYTGGNKYIADIGFQLESEKVALEDHVTDGWFIKSSSEVSSLPDSIRSRLFNLSVATGKNGGTAAEITRDTAGKVAVADGNKYIAKNGNNYFLRNSNLKANQEDYETVIFHDTSAHTYYIINIEEAVSANYMNSNEAKNNYALRIDVASLLSTSDTNITLSKEHWLEKCDISFHDQSVYDYFKSNFPDLFEDD